MRNAELMVATLRIYISACCLEGFVFLGVIDISATFRDVWEAVPYGEVCCPLLLRLIWYSLIATADTARRVPTTKN